MKTESNELSPRRTRWSPAPAPSVVSLPRALRWMLPFAPGRHSPAFRHCSLGFCLTLLALWLTGCATPNVNPSQPRPFTGYVDLHATEDEELWWEVSHFDEAAQDFQKVFSEVTAPKGGILRLAFPPGRHRLRVTFLNHAIAKPAEFAVEVPDGKITPVRVALTESGTVSVRTVDQNTGGSATGRYRRRIRVSNDETTAYSPSAVVDPPVAYQRKERMPYAR
jgi:hypothetical protein